MPSQLLQFRAQPATGQALATLAGEEGKPNALAADRLERYVHLTRRALSTLRLPREEALLLVDVLRGTLVDSTFWAASGPALLAAEIEDAAEDGLGEKWGVDLDKLAARIRSWHPVTVLAITDAVQAWWNLTSSRENPHSWDEALHAVGLLVPASPLEPHEES